MSQEVSAPEVKIRLLTSSDDPLYWPALEFYVESFPRDEREPLERIAKVSNGEPEFCAGKRRRVHMAVAEVGGRLAGIRYFSYYAEARLGFLIYLAVEPELRKRGIGSRLVDYGREICLSDAEAMSSTVDAVMFECERPELADGDQEREIREYRIEYFLRRGAVVVSRDYCQPALGPDRKATPLYLLAYPNNLSLDPRQLVVSFHRHVLECEYSEGG